MTIRNRELSQFGSFIYVDNSSQEIGITTETLPYVGIGTTNPERKLHVIGDAIVDGNADIGIVSATGYYLNGNPLVDASVQTWETLGSNAYRLTGNVGIGTSTPSSKLTVIGNVNISGIITASNTVNASRFISTVSTGTAPFQVTSTTEVTNLNASLLRGGTPGANLNSFDIVTLGGSQTLTNKTLTLPTFGGTGVVFNGSTSGVTTVRASATASGTVVIPAVSGIATVITSGDTGTVTSNMIADLNVTNSDVATNAAIEYSKLNLSGSITNADIASGAAIAISKLASSTISGVSLGSNLNNLTAGSFINYDSGTTYNGGASRTISVNATNANTGNTVVSRDSSGDFSAGAINVTNLTATQTVNASLLSGNYVSAIGGNYTGIITATGINPTSIYASGTVGTAGSVLTSTGSGIRWTTPSVGGGSSISVTNTTSSVSTHYVGFITETSGLTSSFYVSSTKLTFVPSTGSLSAVEFNATSDENLKENITTFDNSLNVIEQLRGVNFSWKDTNKKSVGVIAQELEKVLPQLVENSSDFKTVNYNGIIGVLIEAVKELSTEVEELKKKINER